MRYGIIPDNSLEEQLIRSPDGPVALFDSFLPLVQARAIIAAVRLGVFEALRDGSQPADAVARRLGLDGETSELILRILWCGGYVARDASAYRLTEVSRQTLLTESPSRLTDYVGLNELAWEWLGHLEDVARTGRGIDMHQHLGDRTKWATYQGAMLEVARRTAPLVAPLVPVKANARRLLDIAGSHGLYGALICRAHPPMRSEVLDLPEAVEQSRLLARNEGLQDVVSHRAGNALTDDLGRGYDVVFLGNILHHFSPDQSTGLLARIRSSMSSDGTIAIWESRRPESDAPPELAGDAFALFFRVTSTARCYATSEYTGWVTAAGFADVQAMPLPPFQILVTGRAR